MRQELELYILRAVVIYEARHVSGKDSCIIGKLVTHIRAKGTVTLVKITPYASPNNV